jgi:glycosyltransferase involved in cell wall biosynthesis
MKRRALAISWEMPPLSGPRAVQVSRTLNHLVPLGWESSVICFGPRSGRYNQDRQLASRLRASNGVTLVPVASAEERLFFRALWRVMPPIKLLPDEKWVWIRAASRAARRLARTERFDVLVSFGQPWSDHLIGLRVHRATGLPWVAHFSDPWVDSPYLRGRRWQRRLWQRMEADVVRHANALIFTNSQAADRAMRKYPAEWRGKAHVVPHGFESVERHELSTTVDTEDAEDQITQALSSVSPVSSVVESFDTDVVESSDADVVESLGTDHRDDRLTIVYTGRFYDGIRTPEPLLHALALIATRRPIACELHVAFVGTPVPSHRRLATTLGLGDVVEFAGRVPFAESARRAAHADVLLVIDAPSDESLFLPSKLVDYLPLDKPILALTPSRGASADLIRRLGYPVVPPDDVVAIASAIEVLVAAKRQRRLGIAEHHRSVAQQYDIRRTAGAFAGILECVS